MSTCVPFVYLFHFWSWMLLYLPDWIQLRIHSRCCTLGSGMWGTVRVRNEKYFCWRNCPGQLRRCDMLDLINSTAQLSWSVHGPRPCQCLWQRIFIIFITLNPPKLPTYHKRNEYRVNRLKRPPPLLRHSASRGQVLVQEIEFQGAVFAHIGSQGKVRCIQAESGITTFRIPLRGNKTSIFW